MSDINSVNTDTGSSTRASEAQATTLVAQHFEEIEVLREQRKGFEASVYEMTYLMVAAMVDVARSYEEDRDYAVALIAVCNTRGVKIPDPQKGENPYLHIVRLGDGEWVERTNRAGKKRQEYEPNRSMEKYARAVRWFVQQGFDRERVIAFLSGDMPFRKDGAYVEPNLAAVMAADKVTFPPKTKAKAPPPQPQFTEEIRNAAERVPPLIMSHMDQHTRRAIRWSKDGYAVVVIRYRDDDLHVIGDAGMAKEMIERIVSERIEDLRSNALRIKSLREAEQADKRNIREVAVPPKNDPAKGKTPSVEEFFSGR